MRSRTARWFEVKVCYEKQTDKGTSKKVKEAYVVDALSFSEAEKRITEEMEAYCSDFDVVEEKIAGYGEIFFTDNAEDDKWYKCKLQFITIDEKTEKEKRSNVYYLVQGATLEKARKNIDEVMSGTMIDYVIASVSETTIMDVFEHGVSKKEQDSTKQAVAKEVLKSSCKLHEAIKEMVDAVPDGMKVSVSSGGEEVVIADKRPQKEGGRDGTADEG